LATDQQWVTDYARAAESGELPRRHIVCDVGTYWVIREGTNVAGLDLISETDTLGNVTRNRRSTASTSNPERRRLVMEFPWGSTANPPANRLQNIMRPGRFEPESEEMAHADDSHGAFVLLSPDVEMPKNRSNLPEPDPEATTRPAAAEELHIYVEEMTARINTELAARRPIVVREEALRSWAAMNSGMAEEAEEQE
jgi:hypothetical protein